MSNSLKQFCRHIQKHTFLCATRNSPPEAVGKVVLKVPGKSCDEIWLQSDEIHIIVNLGQKYEGDLQY